MRFPVAVNCGFQMEIMALRVTADAKVGHQLLYL